MFSSVDKFIVALIGMAVDALVMLPSPSLDVPEWVHAVIGAVTAVLVWAVPNKPASG